MDLLIVRWIFLSVLANAQPPPPTNPQTMCGMQKELEGSKTSKVLVDLTEPVLAGIKPRDQGKKGTCYGEACSVLASTLIPSSGTTPRPQCSALEMEAFEKAEMNGGFTGDKSLSFNEGGKGVCEYFKALEKRGGCCDQASVDDVLGDKIFDVHEDEVNRNKPIRNSLSQQEAKLIRDLDNHHKEALALEGKRFFSWVDHQSSIPRNSFLVKAMDAYKAQAAEREKSEAPEYSLDAFEAFIREKKLPNPHDIIGEDIRKFKGEYWGSLGFGKRYTYEISQFESKVLDFKARFENFKKEQKPCVCAKDIQLLSRCEVNGVEQFIPEELLAAAQYASSALDVHQREPHLVVNDWFKNRCPKRFPIQTQGIKCKSVHPDKQGLLIGEDGKRDLPVARFIHDHFVTKKESSPVLVALNSTKNLRFRNPETSLSGHSVLITGLRTVGGHCQVRLRNSWGKQCGGLILKSTPPVPSECVTTGDAAGDQWIDETVIREAISSVITL